ncbi:receptor-type tyrosine-protein phosphatase S-like [Mytilus californianus]|uniref:receptor-type tyrosine-protein phosphatase S-like n=1 Tax=Mytilus californianus TaxID=6549 RepID=UPI002246F716|nr:receptor-type tyrosine-protein phosphatase S-like [Mytilus californianus]
MAVVFLIRLVFCICIGSVTSAEEVDCYNRYNKGINYIGNISKIPSGKPCLKWSEVVKHPSHNYREEHNFCRNPLPSAVDRPYCYKAGNKWAYEKCIIPVCDCRNSTQDRGYHGQIDITRRGHNCMYWKSATKYTSEDQNYCRTPEGDSDNAGGPWCYTGLTDPRWDRCNIPVCESAKCPDLSVIPKLKPLDGKTIYRYGEIVKLTCETGYRLIGSKSLTCQKSGHWNGTLPNCQVVTCFELRTLPKQKLDPVQTIYSYKDNVTFKCDNGYELSSADTITCQSDGTWSKKQPNCTGVLCPPLPKVDNALLPSKIQGYRYPETLKVTCETGYVFDGSDLLQCNSSGFWGFIPQCKGVLCRDFPKIDSIVTSIQATKRYRFPASVNVSCKAGYQINGSNPLHCNQTGDWSTPPVCTGLLCPVLPKIENVQQIENRQYRYPNSIMIKCMTGYIVNGSSWLKCSAAGIWRTPVPSCKVDLKTQEKSLLTAVAVGLGATFALIVVVICVRVFIRRRRSPDDKTRSKPLKDPKSTDVYAQVSKKGDIDSSRLSLQITTNGAIYDNQNQEEEKGEYYSFAGDIKISGTAISINDFYDYVDKGRGTKGPIEREFAKLKKEHLKETKTASMTENTGKNKYKNVFPYDETRVILDLQPGKAASDYINASFINGYGQVKKYIAAQGPLESTINDFWRMIWQYDCGKIVMLTNVFELGKPKCKQYWPDPETKTKRYGSNEILLIDEDVYSDFTIRTLKIVKENQSKTVKQFHFTAWPDKDVPKYASSIVHFRHKVFSSKVSPNGPIIIHCSAGIGRTGTFIALDYIVNEANDLKYIDVFKCVETLRRQRVNMVQTARQYVFLHEAILEAVMCPNSGIPSKDFPDLYKELMVHDSSRNKTKLQVEYQRMNAMCEKHEDNVFDQGKIPENRTKNRDSTILPVEYEMPILSTFVEGHNEYINAVFLPGYKNKKAFIVTQLPLDHTKIDLWRLVYDHNIQTIVMLNQVKEDTDVYWPENQETPIQIGAFKIELTAMESKPYCNCLHLTLKYKTWDERSLVMYQAKCWDDNAVVPDSTEDLFNLLFEVENKSNNGDDSPILVHCLNGCDKSGLYCVLATVLERLRIEQDIDIQHIIKQTRNRRPQIILNYEQFQFIYDAVLEYLKQFETYSNFQ